METRFQTSFIPKKPVVDVPGSTTSRPKTWNLFSVIASVLFVITLSALGGAYLYRNYLKNQIVAADKELNDARSAFETDKIQDLIDTSSRFAAISGLLEKHVVTSQVLLLFQTLTLKNMRLDNFVYTNKTGNPTITTNAEAKSYNAVADQSNIFFGNGFIKEFIFSDFSLGDNGNITMKLYAALSPELVSYKKTIEYSNPTQ